MTEQGRNSEGKPQQASKLLEQLRRELKASNASDPTLPLPSAPLPQRKSKRAPAQKKPVVPVSDSVTNSPANSQSPVVVAEESSYYDFDLAEFPWAIFSRSDRPTDGGPIIYADRIYNRDTQEHVERRFETYPSAEYGHATATTYELAYILMQMYIEQGASDDKVVFGSLRNLAKERGLQGSGADLKRIRRDLDILGSMSMISVNAFWNSKLQAYETVRQWRFFGSATYFMPKARFDYQHELPFGYVEVTSMFRRIASTRGFFALGFPRQFFFDLKPLEQRLAVFLARRFRLHSFLKRRVDDLAKTIPINAKQDFHQRKKVREVAEGLIEKGFPLLAGYELNKKSGVWMAEFYRKQKPVPEKPVRAFQAEMSLTQEEESIVTEIIKLTEDPGGGFWWLHCLRTLGKDAIFRAMGNFKELYIVGSKPMRQTKGAVFTGVLKGIAKEMNLSLAKQ